MEDKSKSISYGEWAEYYNQEEKEDARLYLNLWKKFFLRKMPGLKQIGEDRWIDRVDFFGKNVSTLGIRIEMNHAGNRQAN